MRFNSIFYLVLHNACISLLVFIFSMNLFHFNFLYAFSILLKCICSFAYEKYINTGKYSIIGTKCYYISYNLCHYIYLLRSALYIFFLLQLVSLEKKHFTAQLFRDGLVLDKVI